MADGEINITINGQILRAYEGISILQAARAYGIHIPNLCFLEGLSPAGSCRLCMVEIEGQARPTTACTTTARDGMVIHTESASLLEQRRMLLEMLFAAGHHVCAICVFNGHCELQALAQHLGVTALPLPNRRSEYELDMSHEQYGFDPNRCVLCTRCVRTCEEIEGNGLWHVVGRGSAAHLEINMGRGWGLSELCTRCGKCVQSCPTGALFNKHVSAAEMMKDRELVARLKVQREKA